MICRPFEISNDKYTFHDAICLDSWDNVSEEDFLSMQEARFNTWVAVIETPVNENGE